MQVLPRPSSSWWRHRAEHGALHQLFCWLIGKSADTKNSIGKGDGTNLVIGFGSTCRLACKLQIVCLVFALLLFTFVPIFCLVCLACLAFLALLASFVPFISLLLPAVPPPRLPSQPVLCLPIFQVVLDMAIVANLPCLCYVCHRNARTHGHCSPGKQMCKASVPLLKGCQQN